MGTHAQPAASEPTERTTPGTPTGGLHEPQCNAMTCTWPELGWVKPFGMAGQEYAGLAGRLSSTPVV